MGQGTNANESDCLFFPVQCDAMMEALLCLVLKERLLKSKVCIGACEKQREKLHYCLQTFELEAAT